MNKIQSEIKGKRIDLYGSNAVIQNEKSFIENLDLTGDEYSDRLLIQKCIDDNKLKSDILYSGNTVYPFFKIVKAYRKLQQNGSLENLTNEMYHFFMNACGDMVHYDIGGYRAYYNNSFRKLENELLRECWTPSWHSDVDRIFKELKIGRDYFCERDLIDINKISLNKLKSIINECGWKVNDIDNYYWKLSKDINCKTTYSFNLDIFNFDISRIMRGFNYIANSFNQESYIKQMVMDRNEIDNPATISEIVSSAKDIKYSLIQLESDVLYKARITAEEKHNTLDEVEKHDYYDYAYDY